MTHCFLLNCFFIPQTIPSLQSLQQPCKHCNATSTRLFWSRTGLTYSSSTKRQKSPSHSSLLPSPSSTRSYNVSLSNQGLYQHDQRSLSLQTKVHINTVNSASLFPCLCYPSRPEPFSLFSSKDYFSASFLTPLASATPKPTDSPLFSPTLPSANPYSRTMSLSENSA